MTRRYAPGTLRAPCTRTPLQSMVPRAPQARPGRGPRACGGVRALPDRRPHGARPAGFLRRSTPRARKLPPVSSIVPRARCVPRARNSANCGVWSSARFKSGWPPGREPTRTPHLGSRVGPPIRGRARYPRAQSTCPVHVEPACQGHAEWPRFPSSSILPRTPFPWRGEKEFRYGRSEIDSASARGAAVRARRGRCRRAPSGGPARARRTRLGDEGLLGRPRGPGSRRASLRAGGLEGFDLRLGWSDVPGLVLLALALLLAVLVLGLRGRIAP